MNRKKTLRLVLAAVIAAGVTIPLVAQVRNARSAQQQAQQAQQAQPPLTPPADLIPTTRPAPIDPNKVLASAGDVKITGADFNALAATFPPQNAARLNETNVRKAVVDRLMRVKLLAREAERRKLDQKPQVKQQLEMNRDEILTNALAQDLQGSTSDGADRAYFDANKSSFDDVKARHILIRTPDSPVPIGPGKKALSEAEAKAKADQIAAQLQKGGDFAAIAKTESDDTGSGIKGGDLGTFAPWKMDPIFAKATLGLQKNQVSPPIKTQFGYHIIQLLDDTARTYEQAKAEIGQARWGALVSEVGEKNKIDYDAEFFGSGPATRPAASAQTQPGEAKGKG